MVTIAGGLWCEKVSGKHRQPSGWPSFIYRKTRRDSQRPPNEGRATALRLDGAGAHTHT